MKSESLESRNMEPCNASAAIIPFLSCGVLKKELDIKCEDEFPSYAIGPIKDEDIKTNDQDDTKNTNFFDIPLKTEFEDNDGFSSIPAHPFELLPSENEFNMNEDSTNGTPEAGCLTDRNDSVKMDEEENLNQVECHHCKMSFSQKRALLNHLKAHEDSACFKCHYCSKTFRRKYALKEHINSHEKKYSFKCEHCSKEFIKKSDLTYHVRTHTGVRPFMCMNCSRTFTRSSHLYEHMKTHENFRPFKCTFCSKEFIKEKALSNHLITHSEIRPFKCPSCIKSFKCERYLRNHMRIHEDYRAYICEYCNKGFVVKQAFENHMKLHHLDAPFPCRYCFKAFKLKEELIAHHRFHECPYACEYCKARFPDRTTLEEHRSTHNVTSVSLNTEHGGSSPVPIIPAVPSTVGVPVMNPSQLVIVMSPVVVSSLPVQVAPNT